MILHPRVVIANQRASYDEVECISRHVIRLMTLGTLMAVNVYSGFLAELEEKRR